jgi:hypothetical protein
MKNDLAKTSLNGINSSGTFLKKSSLRTNWLFEVESYSRSQGESLGDLRDNLRIKKALKRAVERDFAPIDLIERIRVGIRA